MEAPTLNHHPQPNHKDIWFLILMFIMAAVLIAALNSCKAKEPCITSSYTKDTTIYVIKEKRIPYLIRDSFFIPNPCADLCDSLGKLKQTFVAQIKSKNGTNLSLKVKNNELVIDDEKKGVLTSNDTTVKHSRVIKEQLRADCKLEHLSKWDSFWIRVGQILSTVITLYILSKVYIKKI